MAFRPTDFRRWGVGEGTDEILDDRKKRHLDRRMKAVLLARFVALLMVGCEEADLSDPDVIEDNTADTVEWSKLQDRDGVIYLPNTDKPFSGFAKRVYENEQVEILAQFKDGYVVRVKQWQENGTPRWDFGFIEGNRGIEGIPWKEEKVCSQEIALNTREGPETFWHENGQTKQESNFKDGKQNGPFISWYENGQKKEEAKFSVDISERLTTT